MENLHPILINIVLGVATAIGSTIVPYLLVRLGQMLKSKAKGAKGEAILAAYGQISTVAYDVIKAAQETFVKETKLAAVDGILSKSEKDAIKQKVLQQIKELANSQALELVGEDGTNVDMLISNMIESQLKSIKEAAAINAAQAKPGAV